MDDLAKVGLGIGVAYTIGNLSLYGGMVFNILNTRKINGRFERENNVLTQKGIEQLLNQDDFSKTIKIFKSAVVDHEPVDDVPYYTRHPVVNTFYNNHDQYRRALIAYGIGNNTERIGENSLEDAALILENLIGYEQLKQEKKCLYDAAYTKILAWNSLGKLTARRNLELIDKLKENIKTGFNTSLVGGIDVLLFLEQLAYTNKREEVIELLNYGLEFGKRQSKAMAAYFADVRMSFLDSDYKAELPLDVQQFMASVRRGYIPNQEDFDLGMGCASLSQYLRNGKLEYAYWEGTPQADIAGKVKEVSGYYLSMLGAFCNGNAIHSLQSRRYQPEPQRASYDLRLSK